MNAWNIILLVERLSKLRFVWFSLRGTLVSGIQFSFILPTFRRDSNWRDILVHSKLERRSDNSGTIYPWKHPRCRTCDHVSPTIQNLCNSFTVYKRNTCSSTCLIYPIQCRKCKILYIGETCRRLDRRFEEHRWKVEDKLHEDEKKKTKAT